jgi:hypothetical protein
MPRRNLAKEKYWRRLLRQWRQSGMTGRDFCSAHHLSEPSFYAWRREIARRDQQKAVAPTNIGPAPEPSDDATTPAFLKLSIDTDATLPPAIEVVVGQPRLLRVRPGFDADLLRQLLRLLEEPSC